MDTWAILHCIFCVCVFFSQALKQFVSNAENFHQLACLTLHELWSYLKHITFKMWTKRWVNFSKSKERMNRNHWKWTFFLNYCREINCIRSSHDTKICFESWMLIYMVNYSNPLSPSVINLSHRCYNYLVKRFEWFR